ncbi:hypothetical protein VB711_19130 [Cronbergia sp. UHCC 0137]|uniref:hypothetical protein n=1 Tax=Cronbergia sp. UHCC 0137 TaxID=3110239 RepID=UPI002B2138D9|nr:hypothetical protein [Cronbergia sp. UHCC 0137]MEA5619942.1 hypothetical protein [Cronbergia sp. UHCC 0137]
MSINSEQPNDKEEKKIIEVLAGMQVEIILLSTKIDQIEKTLFFNGTALISRVKVLETHQDQDHQNWDELEDNKEAIAKLAMISNLVSSVPGGLKTIFMFVVLFNLLGIIIIDLGIRYFYFADFLVEPIQILEKPFNKKRPSP